ncbi:unnamed protein product [Dicrocoelium dendriticum]|nr:unnamed protein product [Dicrocoelium dendriticum]
MHANVLAIAFIEFMIKVHALACFECDPCPMERGAPLPPIVNNCEVCLTEYGYRANKLVSVMKACADRCSESVSPYNLTEYKAHCCTNNLCNRSTRPKIFVYLVLASILTF